MVAVLYCDVIELVIDDDNEHHHILVVIVQMQLIMVDEVVDYISVQVIIMYEEMVANEYLLYRILNYIEVVFLVEIVVMSVMVDVSISLQVIEL